MNNHRLRQSRHIPLVLLTMFATTLALSGPAAANGKRWEVVKKAEGITVKIRPVKNLDLPVIRGEGVVRGGIFEVLAVLNEVGDYSKWMDSCHSARVVNQVSDYEAIIYNRTAAPWPISDRDAVVRTQTSVDKEKKTILVTFKGIKAKSVPDVDGVVRFPVLRGFYYLQWLSDEKTRVTYQARSDPGGLIPSWFVESAQADIPFETIKSLRKQVRKQNPKLKPFLDRWDPKHGGKGFDADHPARDHRRLTW